MNLYRILLQVLVSNSEEFDQKVFRIIWFEKNDNKMQYFDEHKQFHIIFHHKNILIILKGAYAN